MNLLELVPREESEFIREAHQLLQEVNQLNGINIPDVIRLEMRSHVAARVLLQQGIFAIPHIRCIDRPIAETLTIIGSLIQTGLTHVLIVTGDPKEGETEPSPIHALHIIEAVKLRYPSLNIYGALDPYRQSFKQELAYCKEKKMAGVSGFFTQPFFDAELARIYLEQLEGYDVFLGISPVTTENSMNYWKTRNAAIFPKNFSLSLEDNIELGATLIRTAQKFNQNTYMMPIRTPALAYAKGVFETL